MNYFLLFASWTKGLYHPFLQSPTKELVRFTLKKYKRKERKKINKRLRGLFHALVGKLSLKRNNFLPVKVGEYFNNSLCCFISCP